MKKFFDLQNSPAKHICLIAVMMIILPRIGNAQEFTIEQTLSDQAQLTTMAFDGLSFVTGSLGADSFFPPGKVADFWGFQYLRDNDPSDMGHNTGFLTKAANNMLNVLTPLQRQQLVSLANRQVDLINQYGYDRFVLMKAFRRLLENDLPVGTNGLDREAVKAFSSDLYKLDGQISYQRARVMGSLLYQLTTEQKAYLDAMVGKGMLEWPDVAEPADLRGLEHDVKVAVMTYAGDMFSWYAGTVAADVYFCPERQGTYFGSFYMKDAPAVGNPDYTIDPNLTANYGNYFLQTLTTGEAALITSLVETQKPYLYEIVDRREDVSALLRKFIAGETPDSIQVISLMGRYGELDGEIIYLYASRFATVNGMISSQQRDHLMALRREVLGDFTPAGAFLYASPIPVPEIPNTDFLFAAVDPDPLTFIGNELLGRPASQSVTVNACANKELEVYFEYGPDSLNYILQTGIQLCPDSIPFEFILQDLTPDTKYFYRMRYRETSAAIFRVRSSHSFHTARSSGQTFSFAVGADPHLDNNSSTAAYSRTLENILSGNPDFLLDLGDTFMSEKLTTGTWQEIVNRHLLMRSYFDKTGHSVPLFLVPGNHEGELGWMLNGTADNLPVYATNARKLYFPNPVPDSFYSGNTKSENFVGLRENYYAWEWGDALFVVIDPYWYTTKKPGWGWTLGFDQYNWFKNTLSSSQAKFKFVFSHQLVGGNGTDGRGGTEFANLYEMGGMNADLTYGFNTFRPGWGKPIQTLMEENNVTIFFHGHDHFYGKQEMDGVVYQEVPQPSSKNITTNQAAEYGYVNGTFLASRGYLQVNVSDTETRVDYVKTYLPEEENSVQKNGDVAHTYVVQAKTPASVSVSTPSSTVFAGEQVTFSALTVNEGLHSIMQWKVNETPVGTNSNTLTYVPSDHDVVTCKLKTEGGYVAVSGEITMSVLNVNKTEVLSRPTDKSVTINTLFDQACEVRFQYGTTGSIYDMTSETVTATAGESLVYLFGNLQPGTRYYYITGYRRPGTSDFLYGEEHSFVTQRPEGSIFSFTVMSDSHLYDKKGIPSMMGITMQNQVKDNPDFVLDLGDTFGDDRNPALITQQTMDQLHTNFLPYIGMLSHSAPFFFCLGNHEGENGYYLNQTPPENIAVYGTLSREKYYTNPVPDGFYSGNTATEPYGIGQPQNYYAWEWGDALFVVLDAYRYSTVNAKPRGWDWTLGKTQYDWFKQTLETSQAKYKFVFAHHILGETRGGVNNAKFYEWGGYEADGTTWGFSSKRPGWELPVHQLMIKNGVTAFFQGHDHLFARENLDCLTYQEVPMPADSTYTIGMLENGSAYTGNKMEGTGHLRITVGPEAASVDFIRAYLPKDTLGSNKNGEVAFSYTLGPNIPASVAVTASANPVCAGTEVTFTAAAVNGGPSPAYQWKVNGKNAGTGSNNFTYIPANNDMIACEMTPNSTCSTGSPATSNPVVMTVNSIPLQPGSVTGSQSVCAYATGIYYSIVPVTGASGYNWTVPSGTTISSGQGTSSIRVSFGAVSGAITVAAYNACGTGSPASTSVTLNPAVSAVITPQGSTTFCAGGSVILRATSGTGYLYQWKLNGTDIYGATKSSITVNTGGSYTVVIIRSGYCAGISAPVLVTVNTLPSSVITLQGPTTFCKGGSVLLNANTGTGLTYQWKKDGKNITGATSFSYIANESGIYAVAETNSNGCTKTSADLKVTVNPVPVVSVTPVGPINMTAGGSTTLTATRLTNVRYQWYNNSTAIGGAVNYRYVVSAAGAYKVVVTYSTTGCYSGSNTVTVNVNGSLKSLSVNPDVLPFIGNYPNPVGKVAVFDYSLPVTSKVSLKLFDIYGKEVAAILNKTQDKGDYTFTYNVENLAPGVYFYTFSMKGNQDEFIKTNKIVIYR